MKGQMETKKYVYSFGKHGGTRDTQINLGDAVGGGGDLPLNAIVLSVVCVCTTALVGSSATIEFGDETTTDLYVANEAITTFNAAGTTQHWAAQEHPACTTDALRGFGMLIQTADLTAGELEIYVTFITPVYDPSTVVDA